MAERRTVLHVIDTGGPGGAETIFLNLVTGLDAAAWSSIAVLPEKDWLWHTLEEHGVEPVHVPSHGGFDVSYLGELFRLARRRQADLIQTHLFTSAVYGTLAARALGLPVVCTHHGQTDVASSGSYRAIKARIVRRPDNRHVFVSHDLQQFFERARIVPRRDARVIYNGIDCELFAPRDGTAIRRELGLGTDDIVVGCVGNMRRPKDYPTFLRAAAVLATQSSRYRFLIAGADDQPIKGELQALAAELDLTDRLLVTGFRADVERVMNALDVYALSSTSEGFSLTTIQAMASGLPVVATRCGGPEEIVVDGQTGFLVPTSSPEALAGAIHRLALDADSRQRFGRAGRARVLEQFSIGSMVNGYSELYAECFHARS